MGDWNILHISDLHIVDPEGDSELLRKGFYREYLGRLAHEISSHCEACIDCMVVTGDFVSQGKVAHFRHAMDVVKQLASDLKLRVEHVATCIGVTIFHGRLKRRGGYRRPGRPTRSLRAASPMRSVRLVGLSDSFCADRGRRFGV